MLAHQRQRRILEMLKSKKQLTVTELTQEFNTSESTVRRDLISLDELGKLKKVHGGAIAVERAYNISEDDVSVRSQRNVEQKRMIGEYAATLIKNEDFIFLDAGTTTEAMIDFIPANIRATFVTNGVVHARKLILKGIKAYIIAGQLKPATEAVVGAEGVITLKQYNFTKCFLGANGISYKEGFSTPDTEEALIKRQAASKSYMRYVLADSSKFGMVHPVTFAAIETACIITDRCDDERYKKVTVVKEVMP